MLVSGVACACSTQLIMLCSRTVSGSKFDHTEKAVSTLRDQHDSVI